MRGQPLDLPLCQAFVRTVYFVTHHRIQPRIRHSAIGIWRRFRGFGLGRRLKQLISPVFTIQIHIAEIIETRIMERDGIDLPIPKQQTLTPCLG